MAEAAMAEEEHAMSQKIGPRELALQAAREAEYRGKSVKAPVPELPKNSGTKPVKRKAKRSHAEG